MSDPFILRDLGPADEALLLSVEPDLFDEAIRPDQARAFLADPGHFCTLAFDGDQAVGMITATILLHPDKAPAMFVNELGTRDSHLRQGIATLLTEHMFARARAMGCQGIWLGTETDNDPALGLYRKLGGQEMVFVGFGWDDAF
jgi:ribosomal protein S18 acetylase RimI-like enzyme